MVVHAAGDGFTDQPSPCRGDRRMETVAVDERVGGDGDLNLPVPLLMKEGTLLFSPFIRGR
jgi:hypothetical protein